MASYLNQVSNFIDHMDRQQWIMAILAMLVVGYACLKGASSRTR